jgi:hypothetical protein
MTKRNTAGLAFIAAGACSIALISQAGGATGKTETLRYHVKDVSTTIAHADGTVTRRPPYAEPKAGDVLEINSLIYEGNSRRHAKRWSASQVHRCVFGDGPPACQITVATGGSLLILAGDPPKVVNGTGRYQGASGRVVSAKETKDGNDIVARVKRR